MQPVVDHTVLPTLHADTPAWAQMYFDGLSRQLADVNGKLADVVDELDALHQLFAVRFVNREECALIVGVDKRTIQRYEEKGFIDRVPTKGSRVFYEYTDAVKLRKMFK